MLLVSSTWRSLLRPRAPRVAGSAMAYPPGCVLGLAIALQLPVAMPVAVAVGPSVAVLGWLLGSVATRPGWASIIRAALAMDLSVTAVGTTAVAVAAGLNGGFLQGVLASRLIDWALAAWVWVGIPLAIVALPVSVA